jgi:hypothetical protein
MLVVWIKLYPLNPNPLIWLRAQQSTPCAKRLIFKFAIVALEVLKLSEAAKIALLQEVMREAKRNERGGLLVCIVGVVLAVAGFSTTSLAPNSFNLGILGIAIAAIGFVVYLYYTTVYLRFVGQLASMVSKSAIPCPHCAKPLPEGEFAFCPFCGGPLRSSKRPNSRVE